MEKGYNIFFYYKIKAIDEEAFCKLKSVNLKSMYKLLEISVNKNLYFEKNISIKILENLRRPTKLFFSIIHLKLKSILGYKRTSNFKTKNNYMTEKIL